MKADFEKSLHPSLLRLIRLESEEDEERNLRGVPWLRSQAAKGLTKVAEMLKPKRRPSK